MINATLKCPRALRLAFWRWAHDRAEALWHWIYYKKLTPLTAPLPVAGNAVYFRTADGVYRYDGCERVRIDEPMK